MVFVFQPAATWASGGGRAEALSRSGRCVCERKPVPPPLSHVPGIRSQAGSRSGCRTHPSASL